MSIPKLIQGNMFKLEIALKENGTTYSDLAAADSVTVRIESVDGAESLQATNSDSTVTIDDPDVGTVSWQLTSVNTDAFPVGTYKVSVQVLYGGTNKIEWNEARTVEVVDQNIT